MERIAAKCSAPQVRDRLSKSVFIRLLRKSMRARAIAEHLVARGVEIDRRPFQLARLAFSTV